MKRYFPGVWGPEYQDEDQYVRLYITYLRQKIEKDPKNPHYILSERDLGYGLWSLPRTVTPAFAGQIGAVAITDGTGFGCLAGKFTAFKA